jgi:hypothetical protein
MNKELRQKIIKSRKNFFPTLVITILLWLALGALVYFVEPDTPGVIPVFFVNAFFALLFSFSTLFENSRRGLILSLAIILFLLLRYYGIGNIINFLLLAGVAFSIELYFTKFG